MSKELPYQRTSQFIQTLAVGGLQGGRMGATQHAPPSHSGLRTIVSRESRGASGLLAVAASELSPSLSWQWFLGSGGRWTLPLRERVVPKGSRVSTKLNLKCISTTTQLHRHIEHGTVQVMMVRGHDSLL